MSECNPGKGNHCCRHGDCKGWGCCEHPDTSDTQRPAKVDASGNGREQRVSERVNQLCVENRISVECMELTLLSAGAQAKVRAIMPSGVFMESYGVADTAVLAEKLARQRAVLLLTGHDV